MEKDRDRRYQSAGELANDLRQYLQRGLITARRAGMPRRIWKSVRRHPVASIAVVAGILLLLVGGYALRASRHGAEQEVRRLLSDVRYSLSQGDARLALQQAEAALALEPDSQEARVIRARCLIELTRGQEAIEDARRLLAEDPENWIAHAMLVHAARAGGFYEGDIEPHVQAVESMAPDTAEAFTLRSYLADSDTEGVELLSRALEIDPGHVDALLLRVYRYVGLKDFEAALADADRLMVARPRASRGHQMRAVVLVNLHDEAGALEELNRAIEIDPDDPWNYLQRAWRWGYLFTDEQKMLADYSRAIELDPNLTWGYRDRSRLHQIAGRLEAALRDLERAHALVPESIGVIRRMIDVHFRLGQHDEVRSLLDALEQERTRWNDPAIIARAHRIRADAFLQLGELTSALQEADLAIKAQPDKFWNYLQRAMVRQRQEGAEALAEDCDRAAAIEILDLDPLMQRAGQLNGLCQRPDLALEDYTRLIELAPHWADPYRRRAGLYRNEGRLDEALADIDKALERAPRWIGALTLRGQTLQSMGRFEEALQAYDRTVEPGGKENPETAINRALALAALGRAEEAIERLDRQIEWFPDISELYRWRAFLSFWLGRVDEAVDFLDRALEVDPAQAILYLQRAGISCYTNSDCDSAVADVDRALSMEPENPNVWNLVSWAHALDIFESCPDHYDGRLALEMARRVDSFLPVHYAVKFTLGAVLYRHGKYREARDAMERSLELGIEHENWWSAPCAHFFLAMSEWQLGNRTEVRSHFDRGVTLTESTVPDSPLLLRCRDEAARTLGIEQ
jgi:tetratricopeptide (TPR) repeat protein